MKKSLYGKKVIEKLNEENLSLASITNLLFEEEESDMSDLFGDSKESDDKDSKDDSKDKEAEEEKDEKDSKEKSEDKDKDEDEDDSEAQSIEDEALRRAEKKELETLRNKDSESAVRNSGSEVADIESDLLNAGSFNPYYMKKNSLKKFLFEDEEAEEEAIDLLVDLESKSTEIPSIVSNCMNYIKYFDSKVNKAQIIYDIAVQGIIKSGGSNFMSELEDFDELFHKVYGETFPDEEKSPVKKYTANDNFKVAAGAVKSG